MNDDDYYSFTDQVVMAVMFAIAATFLVWWIADALLFIAGWIP